MASNPKRRMAVIINPMSGVRNGGDRARERAGEAAAVLERVGCLPEIFVTERPGHARELARAALERGVDVVAAWGGDGTVNEVASALAFTETPLAIVPAGSGNGLARELGISRRPARALEDAMGGDTRRIDMGEISGHLFVNVAGIGFDACIAQAFASSRRRGMSRYAWLTFTELRRYQPRTYTIDTPAGRRVVTALLVCLANSRQFGNGAIIAPDASVDDGVLNLVVVGARPMWQTLWHTPALFRGRLGNVPDVWSSPVTDARLSADSPLLFHVDGEPVSDGTALTARVHARALSIRVPSGGCRRPG